MILNEIHYTFHNLWYYMYTGQDTAWHPPIINHCIIGIKWKKWKEKEREREWEREKEREKREREYVKVTKVANSYRIIHKNRVITRINNVIYGIQRKGSRQNRCLNIYIILWFLYRKESKLLQVRHLKHVAMLFLFSLLDLYLIVKISEIHYISI